MTAPIRILHLEDSPRDADLLMAILDEEGLAIKATRVETRGDFEQALREKEYDLIISDFSLPAFDGLSALTLAREIRPETPFLFVSGTMGEETAVESLKNGATDFLIKDRLHRLAAAVQRAVGDAQATRERKRIEEKLRERDELFRQITENVDDLIAVLDLNGVRLFNSPSYRKLFGDVEALSGTNSFLEIHPADRERVERVFRQTVATGIGQRTQFRFLLKDGTIRYIESQGSAIRDKDGKVTYIVVVSRDVTDRNRADEQIREQAALLDKAQDAICLNDMDQRILYWNKSAENLYGWTAEEALGRDANQLLFRGTPNRPLQAMKALIARGEWQGELAQVTKTGKKIVVQSRWTLMRDQQDRPKSILLINTDVTEKKLIEQQFLRTQRLESIGALAGGVAHDLNNLLCPILMATELLEDEVGSESGEKILHLVRGNAERGCAMVRQILTFARGASGEHAIVDLKMVILEMVQMAKNTFPRSIQLETEVSSDHTLVMGDSTQLHQILLNLCVNARDAMPEGGHLTIQAVPIFLKEYSSPMLDQPVTGQFVRLTVRDTGAGIPPEVLGRIFEPFFTTKESGKGTGLGLSTVLGIVKNHHGFLEVTSQVGIGSAFEVYLPAVSRGVPVLDSREDTVLPMGQGELILLIDDEVAVLEMTKETLETFNYRVLTAKDGSEALRVFGERRAQIKVVVADLTLPSNDGPATVQALRAMDPAVKIVCARPAEGELGASTLESCGAQGILVKPYTPEDLLRMLQTVIGPRDTEMLHVRLARSAETSANGFSSPSPAAGKETETLV